MKESQQAVSHKRKAESDYPIAQLSPPAMAEDESIAAMDEKPTAAAQVSTKDGVRRVQLNPEDIQRIVDEAQEVRGCMIVQILHT